MGQNAPGKSGTELLFWCEAFVHEEWKIPHTVHVMDGVPYPVRVGWELAVTAHLVQSILTYEWDVEWAVWKELHDSLELKDLLRKCEELVERGSRGLKGGKASGKGQNVL